MAVAAVALCTSCSGPGLSLDLVFPDPGSIAATTQILVTAVEPFAAADDGFTSRRVLKCGEIGVFPPTTRFNREGAELAGVENVLVNRESHAYPLGETWSLDIPDFQPSDASNPWRALMVHVEARGMAQSFDGSVLDDDASPATLLSGCFCVRLDGEATHPDALLDEQVRANCPSRAELEAGTVVVELAPVVTPAFRLEPCSISRLTAPRQQRLSSSAALCVRTIRCGENSGGRACFSCRDPTCEELSDMRNVPVQVTVEGGGGSEPLGDLILTDAAGRTVPVIDVKDCTAPFRVRASIFGRSETTVDFDVECVPAVDFAGASASQAQPSRRVIGTSALPGARRAGGGREPARLATIVQTEEGEARLDLYERDGREFRFITSMTFPSETPRGVHGYYYALGPDPARHDRPLLAVATSVRNGQDDELRIRVMRYDPASRALQVVRESTRPCAVCACNHPRGIPICDECDCGLEFNLNSVVNLVTADIDADGFADLNVGVSSDFSMTTWYSNVHDNSGADATEFPARLDGSCSCTKYGKLLTSFDLPRLGGRDPTTENSNVDFVVGDVTGAFALYALGVSIDGAPCDPAMDGALQCGTGQVCRELCTDAGGRCVQPCGEAGTTCDASVLRPTCSSTTGDIGASMFCAGPRLRCDQPSSIWKLINVRHVKRGRFTDSGFEDVVAIGSLSPAPGPDDRGLLRIMFGDRVDLTRIEQEAQEVRLNSFFDLNPIRFGDRPSPQGPRSVEVADFNGDGLDDLAVLFGASEEVHVWLGGGNRGPGEVEGGVTLSRCEQGCADGVECRPLDEFVTADFDGDGRAEIVTICNPADIASIRSFAPGVQ